MNIFLVILSFLVVAFGQPAWVPGFGTLAAALGFALFWKASLQIERRFLLSLFWFAAIQLVQLSWMASIKYMGPLMFVVYLFLALGLGIQFAIVSYFCRKNIFAVAGAWTLFEWARLFFLCGFTWNPVGLSLADSSYAITFASVFGIFGLSFWVMLTNLVALKAMEEKSWRRVSLWAILAIFPHVFGFVQQQSSLSHQKELRVALVQTGLFPEQKDLIEGEESSFLSPIAQWERILKVLDQNKKVDLLVLPEASLPMGAHRACYTHSIAKSLFPGSVTPELKKPFAFLDKAEWKVSNVFLAQTLANQLQAHVIVGMDDWDRLGKYNAAFHFSPRGDAYERYEKRVLVPMGEYVPLGGWKWFSEFVRSKFGIYGSFDAGKEAKVFQVGCPVGICICLEETFSDLIRELRMKGAELLVNVTNDVWFPGSRLPWQHFDHGRVRAAENGVSLIRSCNTGVTGWVDCFGRPQKWLPISESKADVLYVNVPVKSYQTLYSLWGDSAILAISALSLIFALFFKEEKVAVNRQLR